MKLVRYGPPGKEKPGLIDFNAAGSTLLQRLQLNLIHAQARDPPAFRVRQRHRVHAHHIR